MGNVYWNKLQLDQATNIDSSLSLHMIALGDSWFHYVNSSILTELQNHIGSCNIYALGKNGERADHLKAYFSELEDCLKTYQTIKIVAISAGGNDFAGDGDLDKKILKDKCGIAENINECYQPGQPESLFKDVIGHYKKTIEVIIKVIKNTNRRIVILLHNYDYPIPDGRFLEIILFRFGPWLKHPMDKCGVPEPDKPYDGIRRKLCINLIDTFTQELDKLAKEYKDNPSVNIKIISSAGTLAKRPDEWLIEWINELHPSVRGFKKIVERCWKTPVRAALGLQQVKS